MSDSTKRLAAIMFTDIVNYSLAMQQDRSHAISIAKIHEETLKELVAQFKGEVINFYGDGSLSLFDTATDCVNCAREIQRVLANRVPLRIGIHEGEVTIENGKVYGNGINLAARIESAGHRGTILFSKNIFEIIRNDTSITAQRLGFFKLKNFNNPVEIYALEDPKLQPVDPSRLHGLMTNNSSLRRLYPNFAFAIVIIMLVGLVAWLRPLSLLSASKATDETVIAVLPLKTIGADQDATSFAEGVQVELINHLALVPGLEVKSRTAVERFVQQAPSTNVLRNELQLSHYLEGTAHKQADRVLISIQLIDATTNGRVWGDRYDVSYANIWETQSDIAKSVAKELQFEISPDLERTIDKQPTTDPHAWDDYLQASYFWRRFTSLRDPNLLRQMVRHLKRAIKRDGQFALAYADLAKAYLERTDNPNISFAFVNRDSIITLCDRAISLDPDLGSAYLHKGDYYAAFDVDLATENYQLSLEKSPKDPIIHWRWGYFQFDQHWNISDALRHSSQAIRLNPEYGQLTFILRDHGWYFLSIGDYRRSEYFFQQALELDPGNISVMSWMAHLAKVTNNMEQLRNIAERMTNESPENRGLWEWGMYYLLTEDYDRSVQYFDRFFMHASQTGEFGHYLNNHMYGFALLKLGRVKEAEEKFDLALEYVRKRGHATNDYEYAKVAAAREQIDSAYYHLDLAVRGSVHWGMPDFMERDPLFSGIKDQPRFQALVQIARDRVEAKRRSILPLLESGEVVLSLDEIL